MLLISIAVFVNTWCLRFFIYCFIELVGMLLATSDIAWASADSILCVELLPDITDLVMVYFLIVMVRLIVVWVGI